MPFPPSTLRAVLLLGLLIVGNIAPSASAQIEGRSRGPVAGEGSFGAAPRYYPDDNYQPNRWQLGVQVRNNENGVLLTSVSRGSIAERNGLEAGDTIVTVAGYQVGYVDRRLYDLGDELTRNVDRQGQVTVLMLRRRDGRLINNYLTFGGGSGGGGGGGGGGPIDRVSLKGDIAGRGNIRLSQNAIQVVRVLDITHSNWTSAVVARDVERGPGQFPLNFGLSFDARPGHRYAADAIIYDGPRQYQTDRVAFDAPSGRGNHVKLRVVNDGPLYDPTTWYRSNLGRAPSTREMSVWREQLEQGVTQDEIEAQILGGSEFYDRNRSNPTEYARGVTRAATGREPSAEEVKRLSEQLQQPGANRSSVVEQTLRSLRPRPQ